MPISARCLNLRGHFKTEFFGQSNQISPGFHCTQMVSTQDQTLRVNVPVCQISVFFPANPANQQNLKGRRVLLPSVYLAWVFLVAIPFVPASVVSHQVDSRSHGRHKQGQSTNNCYKLPDSSCRKPLSSHFKMTSYLCSLQKDLAHLSNTPLLPASILPH